MTTVEPIRQKNDLEKIEKFLKNSMRDFLIFKLGINCGLRISDILALDIKDVQNKDFIYIVEKKTNKKRKIPLNQVLKKLLQQFTKGKKLDSPLFVSKRSAKRLDRISAYRIIRNACNKANIDGNFGTHTLRKTFGYHFYKKYKDVVMLQKILNHSHPNITLRYIGIEEDAIINSYLTFCL